MERTSDSTSSTEPQQPDAQRGRRVVLGRVAGAHGLRGQLRVRYFGADPDNLSEAQAVMLARDEEAEEVATYEVVEVGPGRPGELRMTLAGVEGREAAERLRGRFVLLEAADLLPLPDGEYYDYQLVGCRVWTDEGRELGTVREIWSTGAPDVLVVEGDRGEQLIPAAEELLQEVDVVARRIVVALPPGLLDDDGAR